jgi:hypothetical protein
MYHCCQYIPLNVDRTIETRVAVSIIRTEIHVCITRCNFLCNGPDSRLISYTNMKKNQGLWDGHGVSVCVCCLCPPPGLSFFEPNFTGVAVNLMTLVDTRTATCRRKKIYISHGMAFHLKFAFCHYDEFLHASPFYRMVVIFPVLTWK